ncbi:kunitz-type protease inhibitor 2 isoform X2 [Haemorhous mexicanus]|uniref:kunitz-type protease inhibitor 2 isoform X2 n=1 Tax=Haemorhous mexicanus TaxID=30427 RepID=UPI0028BD30BC|nr:kunitz-type protease inhibitor 2 isoform X2 [Haemorhous mexicanus]
MAAGRLLPLLLLLLGGPGGSARDPPSGPAALAARCRLPALTGRCRASIPRWFFNASSGSCESFVFGGCGGNGNNFGSERECRESCGETPGTAPSSPASTNSTLAELCSAPPVTGPCRAAFPRWFYVPAEKSCREFTYGGCRGNANNHRDERECLRRCRPQGDFGDEFQRFFSSKGLALVALVALVAAVAAGLSLGVSLSPRGVPVPILGCPCPQGVSLTPVLSPGLALVALVALVAAVAAGLSLGVSPCPQGVSLSPFWGVPVPKACP